MNKTNDLLLKIPSKTFIVGEYLALNGGPSLILATGPSFLVQMKRGAHRPLPLHPKSCAGQFSFSQKLPIEELVIDDPHEGAGGFGRSSAEFLSLYLYQHLDQGGALGNLPIAEMIKTYQACAPEGVPPSGADLVAQWKGGVCLYDGKSFESQSFNWPWPTKTFLIFRTGKKLATHNHLNEIDQFNTKDLEKVARKAIHCFLEKNYQGFAQCIEAYSDQLLSVGLLDLEIYERCSQLRSLQGIDAVKGCGAMGVDTLLVVGDKSEEGAIIDQAAQLQLEFVSRLTDLQQGTMIQQESDESYIFQGAEP